MANDQQNSFPAPTETAPEPNTPRGLGGYLGRHPYVRRMALGLIDTLLLVLSLGLAYEIGFDFQPGRFTPDYHIQFLYIVGPLVLLRLLLLHRLGLYRGFSRYAGIHELTSVSLACLTGTAGLVLFNILSNYIPRLDGYPLHPSAAHVLRVPWGVVIIDAMLSIGAVAGLRLMRRMVIQNLARMSRGSRRRVLIIGAGDAGEQVARDLLKHYDEPFQPVAFLDPDPKLQGRRIHGLAVAGALEDLKRVAGQMKIQMVVVALPRVTPATLRDLVDQCRQTRLEFKIIPDLDSVMRGRVQISRLRPVEIEDLLGRPPVVMPDLSGSWLQGRRVLVTGAGGSIGSELCRQALLHKPQCLILLGRGENSLYDIHQELAPLAAEAGVPLEVIVGNVTDPALVGSVFERLRPQVVFHAAAHKHVHFMEAQPCEAVRNNVVGTRIVAEAARRVAADRFVLISTDKAVRPRGVMGATKRMAEIVVGAIGGQGPTRFIAVRFGNVLGSRGSVIPLFRRQIAAGGPVTVTHPDITRYFMTIPEAVNLVIEAGTQGRGGEVFLLDMGRPIRIVDLARQLITLSGLEPGRDIAIEFTGMRPGEKLTEELLTDAERRNPTRHDKIFRSPQPVQSMESLAPSLEALESAALAGDDVRVRALLSEMISDASL